MPRRAALRERGARAWRAAAPSLRLLAAGAVLVLAARALPSPWPDVPHAPPASPAYDARAESDDEVLLRVGSAAVAADDPVVEARLLKLARYLETGGTAEHTDAELVGIARDLGLGSEDVVIRRYLVEAARLALERPAVADLPDEDELRAYHARNAVRFTSPARVHAAHVYLSASRRGAALGPAAETLLEELRARVVAPSAADAFGDPFVRGAVIDGTTDAVARGFGAAFVRALGELPAGSWQGPIESAYGLHLVWIEERVPARLTPFDEVRGRVVHALLRQRGAERGRRRMAALRCPAGGADPACAREVAAGS